MAAERLTSPVLDEETLEAITAVTDLNRLQILFRLGEEGRMCVGDIASRFRITRPAISHHLKVLKHCGLVQSEKAGQEVYYTVCIDKLVARLRALADTLERCCTGGGPCKTETP